MSSSHQLIFKPAVFIIASFLFKKNTDTREHVQTELRCCEISKEMSLLYFGLAECSLFEARVLEFWHAPPPPPPPAVDCTVYTAHWTLRQIDALMIHPPTNQPRDNSNHTIRPPNKPSAVTTCPCDILTPVWSVQVFFVHPGFEVDGLSHVTWRSPSSKCSLTSCPPFLKRNFDGLSHDFWTHLRYPAGCSAKCGRFVIWFFDNFAMSSWLFSKMWTFCRMILPICQVLPPTQQNVNVLSQELLTLLWWLWSVRQNRSPPTHRSVCRVT